MYAVINTGGKQYRLTEGDLLDVERLEGEVGDEVIFNEVLMLGDGDKPEIGSPQVEGAQVVGTIVEQKKGDKVVVFKFKKRKMYRRKAGHRQLLTKVKIDSISSGASEPKKSAAKKEQKPPEPARAEKASEKKATAKTAEKAKSEPKKAKPKKTAAKSKKAKADAGAKADKPLKESKKSSTEKDEAEKDEK